jgi:hypothetical protein
MIFVGSFVQPWKKCFESDGNRVEGEGCSFIFTSVAVSSVYRTQPLHLANAMSAVWRQGAKLCGAVAEEYLFDMETGVIKP